MDLAAKLSILADAAKYDASCASSGSRRGNRGRRLGTAAPSGICHTYTDDGRCVSLLKVLYTNVCIYNCAYCINRNDNDIPRAAFTSREIASLTIDFYRRNYIEGLFLSSGVMQDPDDTMERLARTAKLLRDKGFNGYIHLKCVPFASRRLIQAAGRYADRLSVNIELPSESSLQRLTGEKTYASILNPMGVIRDGIAETRENRKLFRRTPTFVPAGQSTQLIIGASPESDYQILRLSNRLYERQALKRVYYAAYIPVGKQTMRQPGVETPPLVRENRLYQADWLVRLYGFTVRELLSSESPWLDLKMDPKQAFAQRHPELFPVDVNRADREMILKVPGIGLKSANRIVHLRKKGRIRLEHLKQLGAVMSRAQPFIRCDGQTSSHWAVGSPVRAPSRLSEIEDSRFPDPVGNRRIFEIDGSFEGLLTAVFDAYASGSYPVAIGVSGRGQIGLFDRRVCITTDSAKADRVWKGLKDQLGVKLRQELMHAFLSDHPDKETLIFRRIADGIAVQKDSRFKPRLSVLILVKQLSQKVRREAHRMKGLVRFKQTGDGRYLALIEPRYDVLPLIRHHFERRFADQRWIIYDTRRGYGIGHAGQQTQEIQLDGDTVMTAADLRREDDHEALCQDLWRCYYRAVNINQRNNPRLHVSRLPRRYWPLLPEKQS